MLIFTVCASKISVSSVAFVPIAIRASPIPVVVVIYSLKNVSDSDFSVLV